MSVYRTGVTTVDNNVQEQQKGLKALWIFLRKVRERYTDMFVIRTRPKLMQILSSVFQTLRFPLNLSAAVTSPDYSPVLLASPYIFSGFSNLLFPLSFPDYVLE